MLSAAECGQYICFMTAKMYYAATPVTPENVLGSQVFPVRNKIVYLHAEVTVVQMSLIPFVSGR